tara:strand:- start:169893 stop:170759 length:867 start_codon:yes stop_codon:yes gene_type:complete
MRYFLAFIKSKTFLLQVVLAIVLFVGVYFGVNAWMRDYTDRGQNVELPNVKGKTLEQATAVLENMNLRIEVIDSVFSEEKLPGEIVKQIPDAFQMVKSNRIVYTVINSLRPPMVTMPDVINQSRRESISTLEALGFKITEFEYQPDICTDCILDVQIGGNTVPTGTQLPKGTALKIVLGKGVSNDFTELPYLVGKSLGEAITRSLEHTLNIGAVIYEDCATAEDTNKAVVIKQNPQFMIEDGVKLRLGSEVDLWLSIDPQKLNVLNIDSLRAAKQNEEEDVMNVDFSQ